MIHFEIDGVEYTAEVLTQEQFEQHYYEDAIGAGVAFTGPAGEALVLVKPRRA